jgi:ABC-2 type transport system ATP-binding protein
VTVATELPKAASGHEGALLEVSGLSHRYGQVVALEDVSLMVAGGEIVGLVGRNGAGKTTTMRAIMGLLTPDAGQVCWGGRAVRAPDRARFGYMPEERGLYPQMPVAAQVRYFARLHGLDRVAATRATQAWLERVGLTGRGMDPLVALSHGNQQRVQLAVALVYDPPLLVLDEPFAGLDPGAVDELCTALRGRAEAGTAVLLSSHQLDLVERLCQRVVILDAGRVLAAGTLDELRERLPQRLRVRVNAPPRWAADLPGVDLVHDDADGQIFQLGPHTDPQEVLAAALAAGPVQHFGFETVALADIYRQLVHQ